MNRKQRRSEKSKKSVSGNKQPLNLTEQTLIAGHEAHRIGNLASARQLYLQVLQTSPNNADALHLLGVIFYQTGEYGQAVALIGKALEINPLQPHYLNNIGNAFLGLGNLEIALEYYQKSIAILPGNLDAINNCGTTLRELGKFAQEIELYKAALKSCPLHNMFLGDLVRAMQEACLWYGLDSYTEKLLFKTRNSLFDGAPSPVRPYHSLCLPFDPLEQKQIASNYAKTFTNHNPVSPSYAHDKSKKIRIGYISADFRDHPTAHLIAGLFAHHDRDNFEVFAYCIGKDDGSSFRKKIIASVDNFINLSTLSDTAAAQRIKDDGIEILMDVMGYLQNSRSGIFALRAAPIQVNYLAYPGTMGAPFIDYIITDKIVLPENEQEYFSEKPIYMPHTYFATDPTQEIASAPSKNECGLPDGSFVFCCFNKSNKIDVEVFGVWMNILNSVLNSVLWLFTENNFTRENLQKAAAFHGVDPARLVFASRLPKEQHLARHAHADLFLDCFNICAHTTAIDALFAGLPLIARSGKNIISRASESILTAIGLEKLVAKTNQDYEKMAIYYAQNPDKLKELKTQLADNIKIQPLFDIASYTKNLEAGLIKTLEKVSIAVT